MNGPRGKFVDIGVCVFGIIGSLLFSGLFGHVSPTLLFFWGMLSLGLVLLAGISLVGNLFLSFCRHRAVLFTTFQLLCNVLPSVYFLIGYAEKTQIPTPPGCC